MTSTKIRSSLPRRVRVELTPRGYAIQVYGQTVFRSVSQQEARRLASALRRALV